MPAAETHSCRACAAPGRGEPVDGGAAERTRRVGVGGTVRRSTGEALTEAGGDAHDPVEQVLPRLVWPPGGPVREQSGVEPGAVAYRTQRPQAGEDGVLVVRVGEAQSQLDVGRAGHHVGPPPAGDGAGVEQDRPALHECADPHELVDEFVDGVDAGVRVERGVRLDPGDLDADPGAAAPAGLEVATGVRRFQAEHRAGPGRLGPDQPGGGGRADLLVGDDEDPDLGVLGALPLDACRRREQCDDPGLGVVDARAADDVPSTDHGMPDSVPTGQTVS